MKRSIAWLLTALMLLSCFATLSLTVVADEEIAVTRPVGNTGVELFRLDRGGVDGSAPYMSGLNKPFGYRLNLDGSRKLLNITVDELATYQSRTSKGTFTVYRWDTDRDTTVQGQPLYELEIKNHRDHDDLSITFPEKLILTGDLYFEVVCLESDSAAGYTPWNSTGGPEGAAAVAGKISNVEPYCDGKFSHAFACSITLADVEKKASVLNNTGAFDLSFEGSKVQQLLADGKQVEYTDNSANGYVTLKATGATPAVSFGGVTAQAMDRVDYAVVKYRTETEGTGKLTVNGNATAEWDYVADGGWHVQLIDATELWGKASGNLSTLTYTAFENATAGDSVDLAYVYLFGDTVYARSFAYAEAQAVKAELDAELSDSLILDFGGDNKPAAQPILEGMAMPTDDFLRLVGAYDGVRITGVEVTARKSADYRYVKLAYRTEAEGADLMLAVNEADPVSVALTADGRWHEATVALNVDGVATISTLVIVSENVDYKEWIDVAYIGLFNSEGKAGRYVYDKAFSTHKYDVDEDNVPVFNTSSSELSSTYFGTLGKTYGQKFVSQTDVTGILVPKNSFSSSSITRKNNAGTVKVWAWNTDYATTTAVEPLRTVAVEKLEDKADLLVTFDALAAGEYYFEVQLTNPSRGSYVAWVSTGSLKDGVVSYCDGEVREQALCAAYLTPGLALQDRGHEYATTENATYDFTVYKKNATEAFGLTELTDVTVTDLCDKGYLTLAGNGEGSSLTLPVKSNVLGSMTDWMVIQYRATEGSTATLTAATADEALTSQWEWNTDGQWHVAVVSAGEAWSAAVNVELTALTLSGVGKVDVAAIRFFANEETANACAAAMTAEPAAPVDPATVEPVCLIDGDKLSMTGGVQCKPSAYDYDKGSVTLAASNGNHPYYMVMGTPTKVAPYLAIRYRADSRQPWQGHYYIGSVQSSPYDGGDFGTFDYESDGQWHTAYIDLTQLADYDADGNTINYFRFDFLVGDSVLSGSSVEIAYFGFFNTLGEAQSFDHDAPKLAPLHTVIFDTGLAKIYAEFREDYTKEQVLALAPYIYQIPGFVGAWEDFEVATEDMTIRLVYTPISEYDPNEEFNNWDGSTTVDPGPQPGGDTETGDDTGNGAETEIGSETVADTEGDQTTAEETTTTGTDKSGCKSVLASASILTVVALAAGVVIGKKKD